MPIRVPPLVLRIPKGQPLTAQEGDDNFSKLRDAINAAFALMDISLNADGTLKRPLVIYGESTSTDDNYVITPDQPITSQADLLGRLIIFKATVDNTGPARLTIGGLPDAPIRKFKDEELDNKDIKAGQIVLVTWDGGTYQMESFPGVVQPINYTGDTGSVANHYVVVQGGHIHVPENLYAGYSIAFKAFQANTGDCFLKVGHHDDAQLRRNTLGQLVAGEIVAGMIVTAIYDGANFQIVSRSALQSTGIPVYITEHLIIDNLITVSEDWVIVDCEEELTERTDVPGAYSAIILRIVAGIREADNIPRDPPPPVEENQWVMAGGELDLRVNADAPTVRAFNAATNPNSAVGQHLASAIITFPLDDKKFQYKVISKFTGQVAPGKAGLKISIIGYVI